MPNKPISIPSGLLLPWLLALVSAAAVVSAIGVVLVMALGPVTVTGALWWCGNIVVWAALCLMLAGTERPKVAWIVMRSTKVVEFSRAHLARPLPKREVAAAALFFALLCWNWVRDFRDLTLVMPLAAMALGIARVVRRAPFSRWQWMGTALLILREAMSLTAAPGAGWGSAINAWFGVAMWWMITHGSVKREDEAMAARVALTQASYFIADGQFALAEQQVRKSLPLATTNKIAAAALDVLAASLVGQVRLAEAERALEGAKELNPEDETVQQRIEELRRAQLVIAGENRGELN